MSAFIHHELLLLLRTIAVGAVLLLCYDLLAAFRNVFVHSDKACRDGRHSILALLCLFCFSEIYQKLIEGILRFFYGFRPFYPVAYILQQGPRRYFCKMLLQKLMEIPVIIIKIFDKMVAISGQKM